MSGLLTAPYPLGNGNGRVNEDIVLAGYARLFLFVLEGRYLEVLDLGLQSQHNATVSALQHLPLSGEARLLR